MSQKNQSRKYWNTPSNIVMFGPALATGLALLCYRACQLLYTFQICWEGNIRSQTIIMGAWGTDRIFLPRGRCSQGFCSPQTPWTLGRVVNYWCPCWSVCFTTTTGGFILSFAQWNFLKESGPFPLLCLAPVKFPDSPGVPDYDTLTRMSIKLLYLLLLFYVQTVLSSE